MKHPISEFWNITNSKIYKTVGEIQHDLKCQLELTTEDMQRLFNEAEGEIEDALYVPYEVVTYKVMDEVNVKALVKHLKKEILGENQT